MKTNAAFVSDVRSALKLQSADSALTDRAIVSKGKAVALKYIKQQTDKRKLWGSPNVFTPLKIELIQVPLADFCEYQSDCTIARSKYKIPKIAESGNFGLLIQGVFTLNRKTKFIEVDPQRYANLQDLNLPGNNIYYWLFNDYLCVTDPMKESVILPALIEDDEIPVHFSLDCAEESSTCPTNPMDASFSCPGYLWEDVVTATANYYTQTFKRSIEDHSSDDQDQGK